MWKSDIETLLGNIQIMQGYAREETDLNVKPIMYQSFRQ